jgi:outer membrane protein OmpA-like peptidoglycan-associated protein
MGMRWVCLGCVALSLLFARPAPAQEDAEGCKDHQLFTRMPNMYIAGCSSSQFDLRRFPVGPPKEDESHVESVDVEGPVFWISYELNEGANPPSRLQIMRNFEAAMKKAGGIVEAQYPGWCKAMYDAEAMPDMGNGCTSHALTMKLLRGGRESWVFLQSGEADGAYLLTISEREAMKQDVAVNELADKLTAEGFAPLYVNFDTGETTIRPDSAKTLDDAAAALKLAAGFKVEVAGHTDDVGTPEANLELSEGRAKAVMAALVQRGVPADRLTAKGYGQTAPVADNRTEEGRERNRRVELVKK